MREFRKYNAGVVAALAEVEISDDGRSVINISGEETPYHLYHSGVGQNRGRHGVALAFSKTALHVSAPSALQVCWHSACKDGLATLQDVTAGNWSRICSSRLQIAASPCARAIDRCSRARQKPTRALANQSAHTSACANQSATVQLRQSGRVSCRHA